MTGLPEFNFPAFHAAAARIAAAGKLPVSPASLYPHTDQSWTFYMRGAITALCSCESIFLLNGWENSLGARTEFALARKLGMTIYLEHKDFK